MFDFIQVLDPRNPAARYVYIRLNDIKKATPVFGYDGEHGGSPCIIITHSPSTLAEAKSSLVSYNLETYSGEIYSLGPVASAALGLPPFGENEFRDLGEVGFKTN